MSEQRISFVCDYMEGAHPEILRRLFDTNLDKTPGYGTDEWCEIARAKIRTACASPDADVRFLVGGTQTNAIVIDSLLRTYQGVLSADTGHIATHEAGAIELLGHKVLTIPATNGKLCAKSIDDYVEQYNSDANRDHLVMPGMVYISQPTELGTLYSLSELTDISEVCRKHGLPLYVDGARLAYALSCDCNDVTLPDLARLTDVFYIGGTKCGSLFGEAVVVPLPELIPHFFTIIKQHGALLAKGRMLGIQFDALFTDDLYGQIGTTAIKAADKIRSELTKAGYKLCFDSPTNQIFVLLNENQYADLSQHVDMAYWENTTDGIIVRLVTSWATTESDVNRLIEIFLNQRG